MSKRTESPIDASLFTLAENHRMKEALPFGDTSAYDDVRRGLIEQVEDLVIREGDRPVWSLLCYRDQMPYPPPPATPPTVNPSLWRQANLNSVAGLFQVTAGVYQVRAFDMSNLTIVEGDTGLILIDPLISTQCAAAALALYRRNFPAKAGAAVRAVIYTHSHVDHFGGVAGVVSAEDVRRGDVEIIAPSGFLEHAVSENVYAGTAMVRRAQYMYGPYLARGDHGQVDCGLGKSQSTGTISLFAPTRSIEKSGQEVTVDGVTMVFQLTPNTEAPAEMNFYFPRFRALCAAENATHNMHNLQTLRGAKVRDALAWSKYLNDAISQFGGETDVLFAQHHWPVWGRDAVVAYLRRQRDLYRYLNDQTLRLLNQGYTGIEIAETFTLPLGLAQSFDLRGYYGSVSHNVKAVYDRYMGWFDGNPSTLHMLPPTESGPRYVEAMGGAARVLELGKAACDRGEYRWAAQLLQHLVFSDPHHQEAMTQQAYALTQLGYQAENATWRNFYLMGAQELHAGGAVEEHPSGSAPDMVEQMTNDMVFDMLACRLDGPEAAGRNLVMNWSFSDSGDQYVVEISNGALSFTTGKQALRADVCVLLERSALNELLLGQITMRAAIQSSRIEVSRGLVLFLHFFTLLDAGDPNFPIITPRCPPLPDMKQPREEERDEETLLDRLWKLVPALLKGC
jgi:alkyl sulfatase BDS1-like metallo-beta-lactamase superfamily hydrolase